MRKLDIGTDKHTTVYAVDEPGSGNACHAYNIETSTDPKVGSASHVLARIKFQHGPVREAGINGIHNEDLIAIVLDRLNGFQAGEFACAENGIAQEHLEIALATLKFRTDDRVAQGVEGTNQHRVIKPDNLSINDSIRRSRPAIPSQIDPVCGEAQAKADEQNSEDVNKHKWRKKPVVIEAWKFEGQTKTAPKWLTSHKDYGCKMYDEVITLEIATLEGIMRADIGDYIIRGVQGEIYPCKPDIFEQTYDKVIPQCVHVTKDTIPNSGGTPKFGEQIKGI